MRERLIKLLEEAKIKALGTIGSLNKGWGAWYADYLLKNDVIPVTKCKRCKWWTPHPYSLQGRCELYKTYPTGEWYCANGRVDEEVEQ